MSIVLSILFLACLIALVVGLIAPKTVIRWGIDEKKTRKNVLKYYGIGAILVFTLFGVANSSEERKKTNIAAAAQVDTAISALEPVSSLSAEKIKVYDEVQAAYYNLTKDQKALVTKGTILAGAKPTIDKFKAEASAKAAEEKAAADAKAAEEKAAADAKVAEEKAAADAKAAEEKAAADAKAAAEAKVAYNT